MKPDSPFRAPRALLLAVAICIGTVLAGSQLSGAPAMAAARSAAAPSVALKATPVATRSATSSSATSNPGPAGAYSGGLPVTGGAPSGSPQPGWPLAVLGLLAAGAGVLVRRFNRT